jgi:hypothetical protein
MVERQATEKILNILRPYAANWSGSLGRGDLVIPQREIPRLIRDLIEAVHDVLEPQGEASDAEVFHALVEARRLPSLQDQVEKLRSTFRVLKR